MDARARERQRENKVLSERLAEGHQKQKKTPHNLFSQERNMIPENFSLSKAKLGLSKVKLSLSKFDFTQR